MKTPAPEPFSSDGLSTDKTDWIDAEARPDLRDSVPEAIVPISAAAALVGKGPGFCDSSSYVRKTTAVSAVSYEPHSSPA
jgi:hypothetical protein